MTVQQLRDALKDLPDDMEVILQKDGEGNGYSPLSDVDAEAIYVAESTWSGDVYSTNWTADEATFEPAEWEAFKRDNPRACILAPVN